MSNEITWTKEQKLAFSDRDKSLLVSASAGSGKTTVMVERIVQLMLGINAEKTPITNFLIVTFTKASATDMKKKLVDKLLELDADDYILEQIENVAIADISDLHSFYSKLISTYFYEVDLDPAYRIVDADESVNLKEKAVSKLFEEKEKNGDVDYFKIFDIFQEKRSNQLLKQTIYNFNDFLNTIIDGENWFKQKLDECYSGDINSNIFANLINNYVCAAVSDDADECEAFSDKCSKLGYLDYYNYFNELASLFRSVSKSKSYIVNARNLKEIKYPRAKKVAKEFEFLYEEAESIKSNVKKHVDNYVANYISDDQKFLEKGIATVKEHLTILFNLTKEFNEIYSKLKREINGLDFNDLEKYAIKILQNDGICKAVQEKYKYVFVDEYQDVNEVQEQIISMISNKTNRFMVGDIKQSIYRFRHCDPEIFVGKSKEFSKKQDYAKLINLNCNFRSDKNILKFVDLIFSGVMTEKFGGVDYEKSSKFVAGDNNIEQPFSVNLCYIDTTKPKTEKEVAEGVYSVKNHAEQEFEETQKAVAEANYVALKIKELIDPTKENALEYKDIAILVQSRNASTLKFLDTLRGYGIPIASDEKYDLMSKNYVQEIINFIKYICADQDDVLIFKVLKSKLFRFSDSELVEIRKLDMKVRFYDAIKLYEHLENNLLKDKIKFFYQKVNKFKSIVREGLLSEVATKVFLDFELDKINLFEQNGKKINEEIDKFISRLPNKTAYEFIVAYPDFAMEYENDCSGNAVNVMTIHKSKGIEFKAVFVINTSKSFNLRTLDKIVIFNKNFGGGLDYFDIDTRTKYSSVPISAIRIFETRKMVEEQQRLLYVALTRAKQKIYVVCAKQKKSLLTKFPNHPTSFSCWFEPIISRELEGSHNDLINFENYSVFDLLYSPEKENKQILFYEKQTEQLKSFEYEFKESINIPLKNSISKIIQSRKINYALNSEDNFEQQKFSEEFASSADRGTLYHKVFQYIDLKNLAGIDAQLEDIKKQLSKEELDILDFSVVKKVLELDVFKQIKKDDVVLKEREFYAKMPANMLNQNAQKNDDFVMQGIIDLLIIKGNNAILLDYKTGKISDEKLENYSIQLDAYADVAARSFNINITNKLLCFVDLQKIIEI